MSLFVSRWSNCLQITKNNFLRFLHFYPLISSFHALWRSSSRRTFRSRSFAIKISSFHAVWLGIRKSIENLSNIYRKSIDTSSDPPKINPDTPKTYHRYTSDTPQIHPTPPLTLLHASSAPLPTTLQSFNPPSILLHASSMPFDRSSIDLR